MADIDISNIRKLDGGLLLIFRELLRRRNAPEVAHQLNLSQSTISHALTRLRELFGDPLFIRKPHGMEPTQRALEIEPQVAALIDLAAHALGIDESFDPASSTRHFKLAAPEFVTALIGAPLVKNLQRSAPRVSLSSEYLTPDQAFEGLKRGAHSLLAAGAMRDPKDRMNYEN